QPEAREALLDALRPAWFAIPRRPPRTEVEPCRVLAGRRPQAAQRGHSPVAELREDERLLAGALCIAVAAVCPQRLQVKLFQVLHPAFGLIRDVGVQVEVVDVAFDVDVRPPGRAAR